MLHCVLQSAEWQFIAEGWDSRELVAGCVVCVLCVLQGVAVCCSVMQCDAVCCSALQCVAVCVAVVISCTGGIRGK